MAQLTPVCVKNGAKKLNFFWGPIEHSTAFHSDRLEDDDKLNGWLFRRKAIAACHLISRRCGGAIITPPNWTYASSLHPSSESASIIKKFDFRASNELQVRVLPRVFWKRFLSSFPLFPLSRGVLLCAQRYVLSRRLTEEVFLSSEKIIRAGRRCFTMAEFSLLIRVKAFRSWSRFTTNHPTMTYWIQWSMVLAGTSYTPRKRTRSPASRNIHVVSSCRWNNNHNDGERAFLLDDIAVTLWLPDLF